ncbi:flagellar hook-basal body complex protein FliE [Alkalicaulis satelles]|uniref:Flagellar hook-basal body complex protein FliE n=1 Tax=Alkalicaulis satelles TaxID=2609175 RepID=A0A5M6ZGM4_9PROT|nr:flagellar hook-basal body complex protein FliE [Alkalicaulis satelles]KAA5803460.1 flagellar hook-basal body complex protein FliE [Alkalicaulis satelles]
MDLAALRAYAQAAQAAGNAAGSAPAAAPQNDPFAGMVSEAVNTLQASVSAAETRSAEAVQGRAEIADVVTAMAAAEVQLETAIAVRDQVIRAYQEIMRMPI